MHLPLQHCWYSLVNPQHFSESLLDLKLVLLVASQGFLQYLDFLKPPYLNGVTRQMITTRIVSKLCLSSKKGSMVSPREAKLQSPLLGNDANLLSLQETPLDCSSRMLGNLNIFMVFLTGSSQVTYRISHSQYMHETQSRIRLLTTTVHRFDNMVQRWRTYHASIFIHKIVIYKWIIITRIVLVIQIINMQIG